MKRSYPNPGKKKITNKQPPPPVYFNGKEMDIRPEQGGASSMHGGEALSTSLRSKIGRRLSRSPALRFMYFFQIPELLSFRQNPHLFLVY